MKQRKLTDDFIMTTLLRHPSMPEFAELARSRRVPEFFLLGYRLAEANEKLRWWEVEAFPYYQRKSYIAGVYEFEQGVPYE